MPEIADGLVEIRGVAREPGYRSKIAVESHAQGVDPVGACVGPRGSRVRMVVSELRGEKIDIIPWNTEPARFVAKALSPARVREVYIDDETKEATVVVPNDQLALAIGKEGLNARLAARLTGWKVDIQSDAEFAQAEAEAAFAGEGDGEGERLLRPLRRDPLERQALPERGAARARATAACPRTRRWSAPSRPRPREAARGRASPRRASGGGVARAGRPRSPVERGSPRPRRLHTGQPRSALQPRRGGGGRALTCVSPAGANVRGLRPQGAAAGAAALRGRAGGSADGRPQPGPRRLHVPAARLLRAGRGAAGVQPRAAADRRRRSGARAPLH